MKVTYQGEEVSIYRLSKLSNLPMTSLYRARDKGLMSGEEIIDDVKKRLVEYKGELISVRRLCQITKSNYRSVKRRLAVGVPVEAAISDLVDRRGCTRSAKLSPSEVLNTYQALFMKTKSQQLIANELGIHQSTVSDIWRGKRWGWLTSPLRYELEAGHKNLR